ncbi:hypothetical protein ASE48_25545 [Mycobacterium sp. Root265]|nr:hypothetical protein ASE48_25545 [Mycobacterium sp. Root265]
MGERRQAGAVVGSVAIVVSLVVYARPQEVSGQVILIVGSTLVLLSLWRGLTHPRPLLIPWVFVGFAFISALWSDHSWTVLTRAAALAVPLILAGIIASNVPFERFLVIADRTLKTIVVVSLATALLVPTIALTQSAVLYGTLRGVFVHRNHMGYVIILAVIVLLALNWNLRKVRFRTFAWMAVYVLALIWTGSAGAVVLVLTSICLYGLVRWLASVRSADRGLLLVSATCLAAFAALVAVPLVPNILGLLGRDLTFTNRVGIWRGAIQAWQEHFWLGYGWGSILGSEDDAASVISRSSGWMVTSTHNGYLSTALQVGALGLSVAVLFLAVVLVRTLKMVVVSPGPQAIWALQVVVVLIIGDFTETRAFANIGWFLLCLVACYGAQSMARSDRFGGSW